MREQGVLLLPWSLAVAAMVGGCTLGPAASPPVPEPVPAQGARPARPATPVVAEITSGCGIPRLRETIVKQVNITRARARSCGGRQMKQARDLAWNRALAEAAEQHSVDMAARRYFDHLSPDGKRVSQRVTEQGYKWRMVGENLAGGDTSVHDVIAGWLQSPEHCQNMMSPAYAEVGVACVHQQGSPLGTYWTMVLATRR